MLAGIYIAFLGSYSIATGPRSVTSLVMNSVQIAVGLGIIYYSYSQITAVPPALPSAIPPAITGGLRKLFRK